MKKKLGIQDFADFIVQRDGLSRTEAETFVRAFFDVIEQGLEEDKFVKIKGLGTFKLISVSERESVNINTGERFQISGHTKVSFTPDASMKELVNRPFAHFDAVDLNDDTDINEFKEIDEEMHLEAEEAEEANDDEDTDDLEETGENDNDELQITEKVNVNQATSEEENTTANATTPPQETANLISETKEAEDEEPSSTPPPVLPTQDAPSTTEEEVCITDEQPINIVKGEEEAPTTDAIPDTASTIDHESAEDIVVTTPQTVQAPSTTNNNDEESPISTTDDETKSSSTTQATQGYVYGEVPSPRKRNWWKTIAILCGVIFLMVLSYFAGYYRMLCPGCSEFDLADSWTKPEAPAKQVAPTPLPQPAPQPATSSADSSTATSKPNPPAQATPQPSATPEEKSLPKEEKTTEKKDAIPATHVVKVGDNVYRISRKYYGTDAYAERIIKENNLKDANTIVVGMQLKLPRR